MFVFSINIVFATQGNSDNYDLRYGIGTLALEDNTSTNFLRSFSEYISAQFSSSNYDSRLAIFDESPSTVILNKPLNGSFIKTIPELNWSNSTDIEGASIKYIVEISDNVTFGYTNYSNDTIKETTNVTQDFNVTLTEDAIYHWRVRAFNGFTNSSFSENRTFILDTTDPTLFNLTSPSNDSNTTDPTPAFSWQSTSDLTFDNYTIEVSNETSFANINFTFYTDGSTSNTTVDIWNSTQALEERTWYWRVTAYDKALRSRTSETFILNVGTLLETTETTEIQVIQPGGGGFAGGSKIQNVALSIINPSPISLFTNERITTPLFIVNQGGTALRNLNLEALTNSTALSLELSQKTIEILFPGQTIIIDLVIESIGDLPELLQHEIIVEAIAEEPSIKDQARFFVNLLEFGSGEKKQVLDRLEVITSILQGNPECLELQELVNQAKLSMDKQQYNKALTLIDSSIQACEDLLSLLGKELVIKKSNTELYIIIAESLGGLLLFSLIYRYYRRRKKK